MASEDCKQALKLLARSRNVLVSGAPGTGKSKLLAEVALAFETAFGLAPAGGAPQLNPVGGIPIPPAAGAVKDIPAPTKMERKVFRTVFHQNSKYRDFVSGITPAVNKEAGGPGFTIVEGTLYRASEHVKASDGAALLIIDEINRGPAVQVFGGAIVAIESDKRLASDGSKRAETQYFDVVESLIVQDPAVMSGRPVFKGTRVPIDLVVDNEGQALSIQEAQNAYSFLTEEHIEAALVYMKLHPNRGRPRRLAEVNPNLKVLKPTVKTEGSVDR